MAERILVVDDDPLTRDHLKRCLERDGFRVDVVGDCVSTRAAVRSRKPALVLLDIGLPDCSGLEVGRWLVTKTHVPFIFVTARDAETDVVAGLELGADGYMTRPFSTRELLARIQVVLRRGRLSRPCGGAGSPAPKEIVLEPLRHAVRVRGHSVPLSPTEFELLRLLMAKAGEVLTSGELVAAVWGSTLAATAPTLRAHIHYLRRRIELDTGAPRIIHTVYGVGYRFAASASPS